jgi:hypothetical protein
MIEHNYIITLLAIDGCEIAQRYDETLREAKKIAKYLISEDFARSCESTGAAMSFHKVEICNRAGDCLFDQFFQ